MAVISRHRQTYRDRGPNGNRAHREYPVPAGATGDVARQAFDQIIAPRPRTSGLPGCSCLAVSTPIATTPWPGWPGVLGTTSISREPSPSWPPRFGRLVVLLEGGYDLNAVSLSAGAVVSCMAGGNYRPEPSTDGGPGRETVNGLTRIRSRTKDLDGWA